MVYSRRIALCAVAACTGLLLATVLPLPRVGAGPSTNYDPVRITVEKVHLGTRGFVFRYTVENRSSSPITDVMVGRDGDHDVAELAYAPAGWNGDSIPSSSYKSPKGWTLRTEVAEEDTVGFLSWSIEGAEHAISKGSTVGGFEVTVPEDDPAYECGHWTVYLDSATEPTYSGSLQPATASIWQRLKPAHLALNVSTTFDAHVRRPFHSRFRLAPSVQEEVLL